LVRCVAKGRDAADLVNAWPAQLIALVEIAEAAIRACPQGADAQTLARAIVAAQAAAIGGGRIYFPTADRVKRLLRDARIWREFDGRNIKPLAAKYRLDEYTIYRILKRQRDLRRKARVRGN
jgi:Mor family transcriptional regulator